MKRQMYSHLNADQKPRFVATVASAGLDRSEIDSESRMVYNILYKKPMENIMARSTDITSFTEHRKNLRDHFRQVRETGRPLFITTNGETNAVVLSPEAYDALADKAELAESLAMIDRSMEDIRTGRTQPAKPALKKIADELRLKLDR